MLNYMIPAFEEIRRFKLPITGDTEDLALINF